MAHSRLVKNEEKVYKIFYRMTSKFLLLVTLLASCSCFGQNSPDDLYFKRDSTPKKDTSDQAKHRNDKSSWDKVCIGAGLGMDYGGIGLHTAVFPVRYVGVFGGFGYALAGAGYNAGVKIRGNFRKDPGRTSPYLVAMYGYTAAIRNEGAVGDRMFYGYSLGLGVDIFNRSGKGYWSLAFIYPFRSDEVYDYITYMQQYKGMSYPGMIAPVTISIGYKLVIH
jgi:hypothetical protein